MWFFCPHWAPIPVSSGSVPPLPYAPDGKTQPLKTQWLLASILEATVVFLRNHSRSLPWIYCKLCGRSVSPHGDLENDELSPCPWALKPFRMVSNGERGKLISRPLWVFCFSLSESAHILIPGRECTPPKVAGTPLGQMQTHVYKPGLKEPASHRGQRAVRWNPLSEGFLMRVKAPHTPTSTGNKYPHWGQIQWLTRNQKYCHLQVLLSFSRMWLKTHLHDSCLELARIGHPKVLLVLFYNSLVLLKTHSSSHTLGPYSAKAHFCGTVRNKSL